MYRISSLIFSITALSLILGCDPDIIEIKPTYFPIEKPIELAIKPGKKFRVIKFTDQRITEVVDTCYHQGYPQINWIVKSGIADLLADATRAELENHSFQVVNEGQDFDLLGQIKTIKNTVIQGIPEIIEGSIQIEVTLKGAMNGNTLWIKTLFGKGLAEGKGNTAADPEKAINTAIKDFIESLLLEISFSESLK
jgi:hypothetical protein